MHDDHVHKLIDAASKGLISRRELLERGLALGLSTTVIAALIASVPETGAAPLSTNLPTLGRNQDATGGTFTIIGDESSPDLDPHSAYSNSAARILVGTHETLLQLKGDSTTEFEPVLADSWEASADNSTFTFKIPAGVTFQDGDPCTANEVRSSFQRFLEMGMGPVNVISRFMPDVSMMEVVDDQTIRFNLGKPQPLFLAAMASAYGPFVVNTRYVEENKSDDDPWAHEFYLNGSPGTGPYQMTQNDVTQQVTLEKFDGYHRGWEGAHFDKIVMRVVDEIATRRQLVENGEGDALDQSLTPED